jgi:hypothetical protein
VSEEGLRVVKLCPDRRERDVVTDTSRTVGQEEAPANYVPAAAVKRRGQALSGITGRKGRAGGLLSLM